MAPGRKARLEALPVWVWDAQDAVWDARFDYHAEHGMVASHAA
jgi:hypothetical protein